MDEFASCLLELKLNIKNGPQKLSSKSGTRYDTRDSYTYTHIHCTQVYTHTHTETHTQ